MVRYDMAQSGMAWHGMAMANTQIKEQRVLPRVSSLVIARHSSLAHDDALLVTGLVTNALLALAGAD